MRRVKEDRTFEKVVIAAIALGIVLFAVGWATRDDPAKKPYLIITGGGFIYNYRVADVFYGFSAEVAKPVSSGSLIVAQFEDPSGGPVLMAEKRVNARTTYYGLRSPSLTSVKAGRPYKVSIKLFDQTRSEVLFSTERTYVSSIDSSVNPDKPLTVGPGYHRYREGAQPCMVQSC